MKVYMTMGLPGSGKSTWAREAADAGAVVVCADDIRSMLHGGKYEFDKTLEGVVGLTIDAVFAELAEVLYHSNASIIIDETHLMHVRRTRTYARIREWHSIGGQKKVPTILVPFNADAETCLDRRRSGGKGIAFEKWHQVIVSMRDSIEEPCQDELKNFGVDVMTPSLALAQIILDNGLR